MSSYFEGKFFISEKFSLKKINNEFKNLQNNLIFLIEISHHNYPLMQKYLAYFSNIIKMIFYFYKIYFNFIFDIKFFI